MSLTPEKVLNHLQEKVGVDISTIQHDTALFTSNRLDSFSLVELILFVEEEMNTKIDPEDVRIENFDSVNQILQFAASRK